MRISSEGERERERQEKTASKRIMERWKEDQKGIIVIMMITRIEKQRKKKKRTLREREG